MQSWMIGTGAAILAMGWMPVLPSLGATIGAVVFTLLVYLWRPGPLLGLLLGLGCGSCYAVLWGESLLTARLPAALEGRSLVIEGRILEPPQLRQFRGGGQRQRFVFSAAKLACPSDVVGCPAPPHRFLLSYYGAQALQAGQVWRLTVRLKRPWGLANPGSFNYQSWLSQNRIAATGSVRERSLQLLAQPEWWQLPHQQWRQQIALALPAAPATSGILLGLSNGDRSAIAPAQWQLLQRYGINHLAVISGLHVGMVASVGFLVGRVFGWRGAHAGALLLAVLYSAVAGFTLPCVRALVMLASVQVFAISQRPIQPWRCLNMALLGVALLDPLASHGVGFWLSFAAVAMIFYLRVSWPAMPAFKFLLLMQLCLSLAMAILASFWFGGAGWLAPLANLIAIPVLSFWIAPLCLLAALLALGAGPAAQFVWQLAGLPVQALFAGDTLLQGLEIPLWLEFRPSLGALLTVLLAFGLLLAHRALPLRWLGWLLVWLALLPQPQRLRPGVVEVAVMDVGQGLAVVVQTAEVLLIYDTGAGEPDGANMASSVLLPWLQQLGHRKLTVLIVSHGDRDHASGAATLNARLQITETWYGDKPLPGLSHQVACRAGTTRNFQGLALQVLHPASVQEESSSNNRSCVVRLEYQGFSLLLPGDIEASVERQLAAAWGPGLRSDVLLVPHHGSKTSSSAPFLRAVNPQLAIYSYGYRNHFGHPHVTVVQRYRHLQIPTMATTSSGAIFLRAEHGVLTSAQGWREVDRYYWNR